MERDNSLINSSKAIAQKLSSTVNDSNLNRDQEYQDNILLLDAMLLIRDYVSELEKNLNESSIAAKVFYEDENGWPAFQIVIEFENVQLGKLSIGAETRRYGPVIYIKNSFSDLVLELKKNQYSKIEELSRVLKRSFRGFMDEIESSYVYSKAGILEEISEEKELNETFFDLTSEGPKQANQNLVERCASGIGSVNLEVEDLEKNLIDSLDELDFSI